MLMVNMAWDLELVSFIKVDDVDLWSAPFYRMVMSSAQLLTCS